MTMARRGIISGQSKAMDWRDLKTQGHIEIDGVPYDLSHLRDRKYSFEVEKTDKYPTLSFELLVQYSSHCVSLGTPRDASIDFAIHGEDHLILDDSGRARCFCERRHALSSHLPRIFSEILDRHVMFTGRENWLTIEVLTENAGSRDYEIFFSLTRQTGNFLRLYVESAYVREAGFPGSPAHNVQRKSRVRAKVLFAKKLRGEAIREPPKR